ncbi:MAG: hypothetical protein MZV64_72765 [Ignavibacteriales bacterium]|nr:hypothetical protein [Ignavibacteriales bacterium]
MSQDVFKNIAGQPALVAVPRRHRQLRQPAEQRLGRGPAPGQRAAADRADLG